MDALTLDQFDILVAILEEGSFAGAARRLGRGRSAITYAVRKLEEQSRVIIFDRSAYRPTLTEAGRALLPRARRIVEGVADYRRQARGIAEGLEAELSLAVDVLAPLEPVVSALKALHESYPLVQIRMAVEPLDAAAAALSNGAATIAVLNGAAPPAEFDCDSFFDLELAAVAAPDHPIARLPSPLQPEDLRDHVQVVLASRLAPPPGRDHGVQSIVRWYVTDLESKHALIRAGLGWGSMPRHRVAADLQSGRLVELKTGRWEGADRMPRLTALVAWRKDTLLGPAGRLLVDSLRRHGRALADAAAET